MIYFVLEGTGTDQQLLIYENVARHYQHDLVMVCPFLQNIRRNLVEARVAFDSKTGARVLRAKPRFEFQNGTLMLRNVPVPPDLVTAGTSEAEAPVIDEESGFIKRLKARVSRCPAGRMLKRFVFAVRPWEPFPEYASGTSPAWRLMEAILRRLKEFAETRPLVIVPVFYAVMCNSGCRSITSTAFIRSKGGERT